VLHAPHMLTSFIWSSWTIFGEDYKL
jgi:hypothetical protein